MVDDYSGNEETAGGEWSVPLVAVQWVVSNASTNVELATLSNVSRRWREIVAQCIVDVASLERYKRRPLAPPSPSTFSNLLLPSMIRHFYSSHSHSTPSQPEKQQHQEKEQEETYCVAWFHPDGIKFKQLSLVNISHENGEIFQQQDHGVAIIDPKTATTTRTVTDEAINASTEDHKFLFTEKNSRLNQKHAASTLPMSSPAKDNIMDWGRSVMYQWDGYSEAIDVLGPFGYTRSLLRVSTMCFYTSSDNVALWINSLQTQKYK